MYHFNSPRMVTFVVFLFSFRVCSSEDLISFLPSEDIEHFVVNEFDIRTTNSSINPRRKIDQSHFIDMGLSISEVNENRVVMDNPNETIVIRILRRGDINKDGIEDLAVCLSEDAKKGSLASSRALILQKYSRDTPLIAIAVEHRDKTCE